jgi:hypothetical protein
MAETVAKLVAQDLQEGYAVLLVRRTGPKTSEAKLLRWEPLEIPLAGDVPLREKPYPKMKRD